jgi:hypothetical protein
VDFIDACKVILRRWYVAVPLLLLTFAGTYYAYTSASSNYTAKASLILISPPSRTLGEGDTETAAVCPTNPWCAGGDVLNLANVVSRQMDDPGLAGELLDPHPGASYEVLLNAENRSTIMELTTTARTPDDALDTLNDLIAQVDQTLTARQEKPIGTSKTPDTVDLVTTDVLTKSTQAAPQSGGKLRAAAAAFGLGIAITLGGVFLAESLAVSRRTKASLLDRIALPDQAGNGGKALRPSKAEPDATSTPRDDPPDDARPSDARPKPVTAGQRRSGRVGS